MPKGEGRRVPTNDMVERFFAAIPTHNKDGSTRVAGLRDYTMFKTMALAGLRSVEIVNLAPSDVDLEGRVITIRVSKGKDSAHRVPISNELHPWLEAWNAVRDPGAPYFWHTSTNGKVQESNLRTAAERYSEAADVPPGYCSPHGFRHNFAVNFLAAGGNAFQLQRVLGHKSITSTQVYTRINVEDIKGVLDGTGNAVGSIDDLRAHIHARYSWLGQEAVRRLNKTLDVVQIIASEAGYCTEDGKRRELGTLL